MADCEKCQGTMVLDLDETVCLQCGHRDYPDRPVPFEKPRRSDYGITRLKVKGQKMVEPITTSFVLDKHHLEKIQAWAEKYGCNSMALALRQMIEVAARS